MVFKEIKKPEQEITGAFGFKTINWISKELTGKLYARLSAEEKKDFLEALKRIKSECGHGALLAKTPVEKAIAVYLTEKEGKLLMKTADIRGYREKLTELKSEDALLKFDIKTRDFMGKLYFGKRCSKLSDAELTELGLKLYGALNAKSAGYKPAPDEEVLSFFIKKERNMYTIPQNEYFTVANWLKKEKLLKSAPVKLAKA